MSGAILATLCATPTHASYRVHSGPPPGHTTTDNDPRPKLDAEAGQRPPPGRADRVASDATGEWRPDPTKLRLEQALDAWKIGEWGQVRRILELVVSEGGQLDTRERTEMALRYLADATLFDATLDETTSDRIATRYLVRLLDDDPAWEPPPGVHGPRLYEVFRRIKRARDDARTVSCEAENLVCQADLDELRRAYTKLEGRLGSLQRAYDSEEVLVTDRVARNRGAALVPFGVGHFYNGEPAVGGAFLGLEAITGTTALGLLLNRLWVLKCTRDPEISWFDVGSMTCRPPDNISDEVVQRRRQLEQGTAIAFFGLLAADILVAQLTFQKYTTLNTRRIRRDQLEGELRKPAPARERAKNREKDANARVRWRPAPEILRGGAGISLHVSF
ncbi:MAG: hypothetical protein V3V08_24115 [Nannocystaceae bacterium]